MEITFLNDQKPLSSEHPRIAALRELNAYGEDIANRRKLTPDDESLNGDIELSVLSDALDLVIAILADRAYAAKSPAHASKMWNGLRRQLDSAMPTLRIAQAYAASGFPRTTADAFYRSFEAHVASGGDWEASGNDRVLQMLESVAKRRPEYKGAAEQIRRGKAEAKPVARAVLPPCYRASQPLA